MWGVCRAAMLSMSSLLFVCLAWAGEVHVYTDREIRLALLELLNGAERTIEIEMYSVTADEVATALARAKTRVVR